MDIIEQLPPVNSVISIWRKSDSEVSLRALRLDMNWEDTLQEFHPVKVLHGT